MMHRPSPWFWGLLEGAARSLRALSQRLEQLPEQDLRQYRREYDQAKDAVNPCSWEHCQPYLARGCSEDHGEDFAAWVVMQGREFYQEVLSHPEQVQRYLDLFSDQDVGLGPAELRWDESVDRDEFRGYQRADYIAIPIYASRFGKDLRDACYDESGWPRE
jgi:hypothetical protein